MTKKMRMRKSSVKELYVHEIEFPKYLKKDKVVIFDADIIAFKVASVCEFKYKFVHNETGKEHWAKSITEFEEGLLEAKASISAKIMKLANANTGIPPDNWPKADTLRMTKLRRQLQNCPEFEDFERFDEQKAEPFSYCAKTLDDAVGRVLDRLGCNKYEMYIGGGENFRSKIPLPLEYKVSARKDGVRPIHLAAAKEYLMMKYGAIKVKGIEADDIVQMRSYQLSGEKIKSYVYSNDKDRLQGWYGGWYNPDSDTVMTLDSKLGEITRSSKGSGLKWLLFQVSQGDKTDGYSPKEWYSRRYGQVGFFNDFNECDSIASFLQKWVDIHKEKLPEIYEWDTWDGRHVVSNWLGIMEMMFSCAYMRLEINDPTTLKSLCESYGVDVGELVFEVSNIEENLEVNDDELGD